MATQFVPLNTEILAEEVLEFERPPEMPELIYIDDPALHGMTDFQHEEPILISKDDTLAKLATDMRSTEPHDMFVLDGERVIGILNNRDLEGTKPTQIAQEQRIDREEIKAHQLMTPHQDILTLHYNELLHARIGNILATLNNLKKRYILALHPNDETGEINIRGLISSWRLEDQLGDDIGTFA